MNYIFPLRKKNQAILIEVLHAEQGPAKRTESEKLNIKQTSKWHSAAVEKRMSASWVLFTLLFPQAKTARVLSQPASLQCEEWPRGLQNFAFKKYLQR